MGVFVSCGYVCAGFSIVTLTDFLGQCGELVDMLASVLAAGHAEAELKVKTLKQLLSEIMSLDHPEVFYRHVSDRELHTAKTKPASQTDRKGE